MFVCRICKVDKAKAEMSLWGGKVSETCLACKAEKKAQRQGIVIDHVPDIPRLPAPLVIAIAPTMGFTAQIDEGSLVISQDNPNRANDPDNITLSRDEAKALFKIFGEWATAA